MGCQWMLAEWARPRKRAEKNYWCGADRLRAVRLLGRQPVDAIDDRRVATIYIASNRVRSFGEPAFHDLRSDLSEPGITQFAKLVTVLEGTGAAWTGRSVGGCWLNWLIGQVRRPRCRAARHEEMADVMTNGRLLMLGLEVISGVIRSGSISSAAFGALYRGMERVAEGRTGRRAASRSEGCGTRGRTHTGRRAEDGGRRKDFGRRSEGGRRRADSGGAGRRGARGRRL